MESKEVFTTGHKDIDWLIFDELSDDDIIHLCQLNKEMSRLCDNEEFWEFRAKKRYPEFHKTKPKYTGYKSFYAQTRGLPHLFDDISLDKWNIKTLSYSIVLPKKAFTRFDKYEAVNKGDIVNLLREDYGYMYIVTKIKENQVTLTKIETDYNTQTKIGVWKIITEAEGIFLKLGINSYKHIFNFILSLYGMDQLEIRVHGKFGKHTFKYPA